MWFYVPFIWFYIVLAGFMWFYGVQTIKHMGISLTKDDGYDRWEKTTGFTRFTQFPFSGVLIQQSPVNYDMLQGWTRPSTINQGRS